MPKDPKSSKKSKNKDKKPKDRHDSPDKKDTKRDVDVKSSVSQQLVKATPATDEELKRHAKSFDVKQKYTLLIQPDDFLFRGVPGEILAKYAPFLDGTYMDISKERLEKFRKTHPEMKDVKDDKVLKNANLFPAYEHLIEGMQKDLDPYTADDTYGTLDLGSEKLFIGSTHW
jgi:hypothetical protein